jgi:hypothetical protein
MVHLRSQGRIPAMLGLRGASDGSGISRTQYSPYILAHGLIASAQNPSSASTTCTAVKPAAVSISGKPLFGCPA